ncbi:hypothetical protein HQ545_08965 [Candidatus Woesearchaeota archaeon]|nr:hypothetical protein [Candidatus Woesearchaeota archaeon]
MRIKKRIWLILVIVYILSLPTFSFANCAGNSIIPTSSGTQLQAEDISAPQIEITPEMEAAITAKLSARTSEEPIVSAPEIEVTPDMVASIAAKLEAGESQEAIVSAPEIEVTPDMVASIAAKLEAGESQEAIVSAPEIRVTTDMQNAIATKLAARDSGQTIASFPPDIQEAIDTKLALASAQGPVPLPEVPECVESYIDMKEAGELPQQRPNIAVGTPSLGLHCEGTGGWS